MGSLRRAIIVQDVDAPPSVCLDRISDLSNYPNMVKYVRENTLYEDVRKGKLRIVKSRYVVCPLPYWNFEYFMEHQVDEAQCCMTFHLDYARRSDMDDSCGYWWVQAISGSTKSRVFYSTIGKLRGWVPPLVLDILTVKALKDATSWVKAEAENKHICTTNQVDYVPGRKPCISAKGVSAMDPVRKIRAPLKSAQKLMSYALLIWMASKLANLRSRGKDLL